MTLNQESSKMEQLNLDQIEQELIYTMKDQKFKMSPK